MSFSPRHISGTGTRLVSALRVDRRSASAPPRRGALRGDEELADLAAQGRGVGDDGTEIDVVGHAVEGAAERDERAGVVGRDRVLGIVDDRPGMGQLAPDLNSPLTKSALDTSGLV